MNVCPTRVLLCFNARSLTSESLIVCQTINLFAAQRNNGRVMQGTIDTRFANKLNPRDTWPINI